MQYTNKYTKYLQLRNNTYYFRFKVPTHLKKLTPQKEIVRSLKTDSLNDACAIISTKIPLLRLLKRMNPTIEHAKSEVNWKKWSVLLAIYTGARRSEIVKFLKDGVQVDESGILFFELKEGKTDNAPRKIPVHKKLIELGIKGVKAIEVKEKAITDYANRLRDLLEIPISDTDGNKRVFHAFRHSFITQAVSQESSIELIQEIVGHRKHRAGITSRYIHKTSLAKLSLIVDSVMY